MTARPDGVGDIEYLDMSNVDVPTVDLPDDDPRPSMYGPDGAPLRWWRRPVGFERSTS